MLVEGDEGEGMKNTLPGTDSGVKTGFCLADDLTFPCVTMAQVRGTPPMNYRWRHRKTDHHHLTREFIRGT